MPEYKCVDVNVYYVTYNCIGWALGISQWLNPDRITNYIMSKGLTHEQAIERFVNEKNNTYPSGHVSNFGNIINKFNTTNCANPLLPSNNTVGFYFNGNDCKHGSRYLETVNQQNISQWTSKLGQEILVSHEADDLLYHGSLYGDKAYYFEFNDHA